MAHTTQIHYYIIMTLDISIHFMETQTEQLLFKRGKACLMRLKSLNMYTAWQK